MFIVGDSGVGKSAIVDRAVDDEFIEEDHTPTKDYVFHNLLLPIPKLG